MKKVILDSYAILAFLFLEKGNKKVLKLLEDAAEDGVNHLIASPNWTEVRYMVERKVGIKHWSKIKPMLLSLPIKIVEVDITLAEQAGAFKAKHKMSLADCFAAALAKQEKAELYTGDTEFRNVESDVKIVWL